MKKMHLDEEQRKKLDNFWYYYKFHVIGGIFILFCIGLFIHDMVSKTEYDYSIAFMGTYPLIEEDKQMLQEWFEANGEDLNGDGEVHVDIADYFLNEESNPQLIMANQTRIMADAQEDISMIFFLNQDTKERFKDQEIFPEITSEYVNIRECKGFKEAGSPISVQDLEGTMRLIYTEPGTKRGEKTQKYYDASRKLLDKFIGR